LTPRTKYYYKVSSTDQNGNVILSSVFDFTTEAEPDTSAPVILSGPDAVMVSTISATIKFTTNEICISTIEYGTSTSYSNSISGSESTKEHTITITNLKPSTEYQYKVSVKDPSDNSIESSNYNFTTEAEKDTTKPEIVTGPYATFVSENSAVIEWETDEQADGRVTFGISTSTEKYVYNYSYQLRHKMTLTNLKSDQKYLYKVISKDAAQNEVKSGEFSFNTLAAKDTISPVIIKGPAVVSTTEKTATIEWETDELASGVIDYGVSSNYGKEINVPDKDNTHIITITNLQPSTEYHFRVVAKDVEGNVTNSKDNTFRTEDEKDTTAPFVIQGPGITNKTHKSAQVEWQTDEISNSKVFFGKDINNLKEKVLPKNVKNHKVLLSNLDSDTKYYYKISSRDQSGNTYVSGTFRDFTTMKAPDTTRPLIISEPAVLSKTEASAVVQWVTDEASNSIISYGTDSNLGKQIVNTNFVDDHRITLTNLNSDTKYYFKVISEDASKNSVESDIYDFKTDAAKDLTPPVLVKKPYESGVTDKSAAIIWSTDELANSIIEYGKTSSMSKKVESSEFVKNHNVMLVNLEPGTQYFFRVKSSDASDNQVTSDRRNFTTKTEKDTVSPKIIEGPYVSSLTDISAIIEWKTDEAGNSIVDYGSDGNYALTKSDPANVEQHKINLTNLTPDTEYLYRVITEDRAGNYIEKEGFTFKTQKAADTNPPVVISGPIVIGLTYNRASIKWKTDENATSKVIYGIDTTYGKSIVESSLKKNRVIDLTNLSASTDYHYKIVSTDINGNKFTSSDNTFKTKSKPDTEPPVIISGPYVPTKTYNSAVIEWKTNEIASSIIEYGLSESYDKEYKDNTYISDHRITLTNLKADKEYHFSINTEDPSGNLTVSEDLTFRTSAAPDTVKPVVISGPYLESSTDKSAVIRWETDENSTSFIEYGLTSQYGTQTGSPAKVTNHVITLTNLEADKEYHYSIISEDGSGNIYRGNDKIFKTQTAVDSLAPIIISGPAVVSKTQTSVTIEWKTNEAANSFVNYGLTANYTELTGNDDKVTFHRIILTNLEGNTTYNYRIESTDFSENTVKSSNSTFKTLAEIDSTAPIVIKGPIATNITHENAVIEWETDEMSDAFVEYGLTSGLNAIKGEADKQLKHSIKLTNLEADTVYYYKIKSKDINGNKFIGKIRNFRTKAAPDTIPPYILTGPMVIAKTHNSATIEWTTDEASDSYVDYGKDRTVSDGTEVRGDRTTYHKIVLTNFESDKIYYYRVRSSDIANHFVESKVDSFKTRKAPDNQPPVFVKYPYVSNVSYNSATIEWETDEPSDSRIDYGFGNNLEFNSEDGDMVESHKIVLTNLKSDTVYNYIVKSKDFSKNENSTSDNELTFATADAPDTIAPVIIKGPVVTHKTHNTATIEWETDEVSDSYVEYGFSKNYGSIKGNAEYVTEHKIILTNLTSNTEYHYSVNSKDFNENIISSGQYKDYTFITEAEPDTLPPVIVKRPIVEAKDNKAYFEWETDEPSNSWVLYQPRDKSEDMEKVGDPQMVTTHKIIVTGLKKNTDYVFTIVSEDYFGNKVSFPEQEQQTIAKLLKGQIALQPPGGNGTFVTNPNPDTQAPIIISGPVVVAKTNNSFTLQWETDERSNSVVNFSLDQSLSKLKVSADNVITHSITVTNLASSTTYNYKVGSSDIDNNGPTNSQVYVITTDAESDVVPPKFTYKPVIISKTESQATIYWKLDESANSIVKFGTDSLDLDNEKQNTEYQTEHSFTLTNLNSDTKYYYKIGATDLVGNGPAWSYIKSFVTESAPDMQPPEIIEGPKLTTKTDNSVTIQWKTDEISDSFVKYGKTSIDENNVGSSDYAKEHSITLVNLEPNTNYIFRVGSTDQSGNEVLAYSETFKTEAQADVTPPAIPTGLNVIPGSQEMYLEWKNNTEGDLAGYNIFRRSVGDYKKIASAVTDSFYFDKGLENGTEYTYYITAFDKTSPSNESGSSDRKSAIPDVSNVLTPPVLEYPRLNERVVLQPVLQVYNSGNKIAGRETTTYDFMVSTDSLFQNIVTYATGIQEDDNITSYEVEEILEHNVTYYWKVRSYDGVFYSDWMPKGVFIADATAPVKIEMAELYAEDIKGEVVVKWRTGYERNNLGFNIYRSTNKNGDYVKLNEQLISGEQYRYEFRDRKVEIGCTYYYKLESIGVFRDRETFEPVSITVSAPKDFVLLQNYPNPFNPVTNIKFNVPRYSKVELKIYNILGQEVKTLVDGRIKPGYYNITWDGRNNNGMKVASGIYIYRLRTEKYVKSLKMVLIK